jgi:aminopeptidase-like protein
MSSRSTFKYPFPVTSRIDRARMHALVGKHWRLNRTAVNADTDQLAHYLRGQMQADLVEAKAGEECLTWRIPHNWKVRRGQLCKLDGTVLADFADNPLHLWTHSVAFQGEVDRDTLIAEHVYADPRRPDEIPYHYRNGYRSEAREWGFSLPYRLVASMTETRYRVDIDTDLDTKGTLKVVDAFLPGEYPDTIFIMAHTCHPALVSDGIACIATAVELFHHLRSLPQRKFSYRFLFGPEYFAAAAYLTHAGKERIEKLRYGIYLDMLSTHEPLGFQCSMQGNSRMDHVIRNVVKSHTDTCIERPYRRLWGNDETFYNGPGFLIPTVGVGRGMHREYHYDTDNLENMSLYHMIESVWVLMRIAEVFESDYVPERAYSGPLYLSRYGLYVDPTVDKDGARNIERMQAMLDGKRSCMDIAQELGIDFYFARSFFDRMAEKGLLRKAARTPRPSDAGELRGPGLT